MGLSIAGSMLACLCDDTEDGVSGTFVLAYRCEFILAKVRSSSLWTAPGKRRDMVGGYGVASCSHNCGQTLQRGASTRYVRIVEKWPRGRAGDPWAER